MILNTDDDDKKRNVIPRLRDFKTTLALGELRSVIPTKLEAQIEIPDQSLDELIEDWHEHRTLSFATDLVSSGFALGKVEEIREAADFILSSESSATALQKRIARQAKDPDYCSVLAVEPESVPDSKELIDHSRKQVKKHRAHLRNSFRNPVRLVELAREYATLGSIKKAVRTMNVAVALAPANRFVLRSAVRLYVHAGELDKAHYILRHAPSLRSDTWLLAAEIAVASKRGQTSQNIKRGMDKIEDANYNPFDLSELTSAIATLEMESANSKLARKLYRKSLRKPTENSIAQVEWASRTMENLGIETREYDAPRNFEALAWNHYKNGEMKDAISQGRNWILDQPFAVSPVIFTGIASALTENFELSRSIYKFGLRANPENLTLRNNYAFVLASDNDPEGAEEELARIDKTNLHIEDIITITATEGLTRFRKGFPEEGRELYKRAIEMARENNEPIYALRALIYLSREEIYAKSIVAEERLELAENESKRFQPTPERTIIFERLRKMLKANKEENDKTKANASKQ